MPQSASCCSSCSTSSGVLYGSACRHITLCLPCGRAMALNSSPCTLCGLPVKTLVREFDVILHPVRKPQFLGTFPAGLPSFSTKQKGKGGAVDDAKKWKMHHPEEKEQALKGGRGPGLWLLEDINQGQKFEGALQGGQQSSYYVMATHGKHIVATPIDAWYNFQKVARHNQLTLEEAEDRMKNRRKTAAGGWLASKKAGAARANTGSSIDEDEEGPAFYPSEKGDVEDEGQENMERGDDWEHEETFTDDDEEIGDKGEEDPVPPPPEAFKKDEEEEEQEQEQLQDGTQEKGVGLSESGFELKRLLAKSGATIFDEALLLEAAPKQQTPPPKAEEVAGTTRPTSPARPTTSAPPRTTTASTAVTTPQGKRTRDEADVVLGGLPSKRIETEEVKAQATTAGGGGGVSEEDVRAFLGRCGPVKSQDLAKEFKSRMTREEDRKAFAALLKKVSTMHRNTEGNLMIVLRG